jgi:hypothetical protein
VVNWASVWWFVKVPFRRKGSKTVAQAVTVPKTALRICANTFPGSAAKRFSGASRSLPRGWSQTSMRLSRSPIMSISTTTADRCLRRVFHDDRLTRRCSSYAKVRGIAETGARNALRICTVKLDSSCVIVHLRGYGKRRDWCSAAQTSAFAFSAQVKLETVQR